MTELWDTSVASRLQPGRDELGHALRRHAVGDPVLVAAPAVTEMAYGLQLRAGDDPRFGVLLAWLAGILDDGTLTIVPFGHRAAYVAGRIRGRVPHAPSSRRDRRSKTMRQAAWLLDIQIAATAFAAGLDVVTENRDDFERVGEVLRELYPDAPPLAVVDSPFS